MIDPTIPYDIRKAAAIMHLKDARTSLQLAQETITPETHGMPTVSRAEDFQTLEKMVEALETFINKLAQDA